MSNNKIVRENDYLNNENELKRRNDFINNENELKRQKKMKVFQAKVQERNKKLMTQ